MNRKSRPIIISLIAACIGLLLISSDVLAFDYVLGTALIPRPSVARPAKGASIAEPNFHTSITRVTGRTADGLSEYLTNEYSKSDPENCNGTILMLAHSEYTWYIYNATNLQLIRKLDPIKLGFQYSYSGGPIEPRWDPVNPNVFYFVVGTQFRKYDVSTDQSTVLHDFINEYPTAATVGTDTEGEPSRDSRIWAWFIKAGAPNWNLLAIVVYDKDFFGANQGKIIKTWNSSPMTGNFISVSPSGNYVFILHYDPRWGSVYPVADFPNTYLNVYGADGHGDWAVAANGDDLYFYQNNANDKMSIYDCVTNVRTDLFTLPTPCCNGIHPCGNNYLRPGWGLVSTYETKGNWMDNQLFMVELKANGKIWRLSDTYSSGATYWSQAFATINRKGTRIYWGSTWGGADDSSLETFMIDLPSNWDSEIQGGAPDTTPPLPPTRVQLTAP